MTIDIETAREILDDFRREFETDKFSSIKNIDDMDFDTYSGDYCDYSQHEFVNEYQEKFDMLWQFVQEYDVLECHWNDLDIIADANPNTDEVSIELCFKYLNQFLNKIEAEQHMIKHLCKD